MIIASIDLMGGRAVQLRQGERKVLERDDPEALAREFDRYGEVAVIDLDAAMGTGDNSGLVSRLCRLAECRVGGGIRDVAAARRVLSYGAAKVIAGTAAFEGDRVNEPFLEALVSAVGRDRIVLAVDAREGEIVTRAWKHRTGLDLLETVPRLLPYAGEFLFTCVEKEGMLQGTDLELASALRSIVDGRLTVAGGVHTMEQVRLVAALGADVQLGMALFTGRIGLAEGFVESLSWKEPLLPVVTCDEGGQVLMLAYADREALHRTFESGRMCYHSRSRSSLWVKGETSGHFQELVRLRADCDRDALLATVRQTGRACHFEQYSCFGGRTFNWQALYDVVSQRLADAPPGSYTASLDGRAVRDKLLEEAGEAASAPDRDNLVWECADLLYFMSVLMAKERVTPADVLRELVRRRSNRGGK